ncbi:MULTISPECIES: LysR family transcriptional regulator [unclassified Paenibacillus]|uniref:LysR family transcriptional regulator n=1 Tax=unclassified Paenibacillus TaxID=185978 RepID=UPI001AE7515D|nr:MULTISPECIES: LysR family transcriptional regulator [unclassified Paenibacillus]MBP1155850.1 DNA-binding transcriptional LysR family regulator [Paenibacillus sp. PvP091]MBP1168764.1 DNA-binding transcriptional LysR family regulator [Paenibacillus sp. PvR098]MBP2439792.1 DNA-binding transcriptional LysR family regulator [Paenibacillus sp. PvP052]
MDDKDWSVLQAVYQEKNITRAAQKLHISQPALTYRLNQLGEHFDIQIFVRGKRELKFTKEGEHLVDYANKMVIELRKLKDQLQDLKQQVSGELRLAVSSNFAQYKLPSILKSFHDHYPNVQFNVHTGWSVQILEHLAKEEIHVGIIRGDYEWDESKILMGADELCLISKKHISLENLPNLPRIRHQTDPDAKRAIEQWWQGHFSQPPYISMEVDKLETCKEMVLNGLGYGIIPHYLLSDQDKRDDLFIHPLILDGKPILRKLWAFYHEDDTKLSVVKAFVEFLRLHYTTE